MTTQDCIFCRIIAHEILCHDVYEDSELFAFLDIHPVNYGHVLIIPRQHYTSLMETPDHIVSCLFTTAKKLMAAIKKAMEADFVVLSIVGIDVPHVHVHLVPRYLNDGLANFWPSKNYKDGQAAIVATTIKRLLS